MQVGQVRVDEPRIADYAAAQVIGLQALCRTGEQRRTEGRLDFVQRLGRARLADGDALGRAMQRAAVS